MEERLNSIEKSFLPILLLFHITGLECVRKNACLNQARFHSFIWESPRYLFRLLQCIGIVTEVFSVVFLPEKKQPAAIFILASLQIITNLQVCRSGKQIRVILMKLWKCKQMLQCDRNEQKFKASILSYCFVMMVMFISYTLLYRFSNEFRMYQNFIENFDYNSQKLNQYFMLIPEIRSFANPTTTSLGLISLTAYYGFVCFYIKFLFNRIEEKIRHLNKDCSYVLLIQSYLELTSIMKSLDDYLSFSAFVIVLSAMFGLFFINFNIIFLTGDFLRNFIGEIWFLVLLCMVILSASAVNSAFITAKEAIQSLPWKIPQYHTKLKVMIRSECITDISLTLWKTYKIERSLIFGAMGTLVTYGILLATLGGL
ncbi:uncharacterized protein TNIN_368391 [Trichonephila inaurata madagascariensis]|uniref:Gustatory receptor n=1 Tax=Trichonephila inaurata madagascariensis TaxID=2747483 RepID=A0A8X6IHH8_9ARAC|nr:uncharacterized protein TNIN_368391 [Trichonephila inaurata madagascariensis]